MKEKLPNWCKYSDHEDATWYPEVSGREGYCSAGYWKEGIDGMCKRFNAVWDKEHDKPICREGRFFPCSRKDAPKCDFYDPEKENSDGKEQIRYTLTP